MGQDNRPGRRYSITSQAKVGSVQCEVSAQRKMSVVKKFPVEKEYEKNPEILPEEIQKFREWLDTQPHLPGKHLTELDLILAYHCCECSLQVSKQVLDLHYTLRTLFSTFFKDRCFDSKVESALHTVLFAPLPTPSVFGYRIMYAGLLDFDSKNFNINDAVRAFMMTFDLWQLEEGTWPGLVIIINMDRTTLGHIGKLDVMTVKKVLYFVQECMLMKLKEVHFMNAPHFIDKLMMLLRPFLKKALMDIIYIHPVGADTLQKYISVDALPKTDGGSYKGRETIRDELIQRIKANGEFFREENLRRVDESLRPGGTSKVQDMFGLQGSFKKLDID